MKANKLSIFASCTLALILLLGMNSCTSELGVTQEVNSPTATLMLNTNLSTRTSSTIDESSIARLRVLVYEAFVSGEKITYSSKPIGGTFTSSPTSTIRVEYPKCPKVAAFIIANEEPSWNLESKNYTVDQLKEWAVTCDGNVAAPLVAPIKMYAETKVFPGNENAKQVIYLVRNVARVDVKLAGSNTDLKLAKEGMLRLTKAHIFNMPKSSQLGQPIKDYDKEYVNGGEVIFKEGINYKTTLNGDAFESFTTLDTDGNPGSITFYVPEHFVKEVGTYTYMTIEGKYYPAGEGEDKKAINVIYTLPIGNDIKTEKIKDPTLFSTSDLTIERNVQYRMVAQIRKIEQISDVVVSVQPWKLETVEGSIEDKEIRLNVSSIKTSIVENAQDTTLVQFWSNQLSKDVRVLPMGTWKQQGNTDEFSVNDIFNELADTDGQTERPGNLWFNNAAATESWGHLKLQLNSNATNVKVGQVYTITLAAGGLHRTIDIEIIAAPVVLQKEESN